jgi:crotonobetaine/carnitine-CoA ligase
MSGGTPATSDRPARDRRVPLPVLVREHARERPDERALTSIGQGTLTWAQLQAGAEVWAHWLAAAGVRTGDRVVTLVPQSHEAAHVWLGCGELGAVEVSVNTEFRGSWLRHTLTLSQARIVVTATRHLEQLLAVVAGTPIERVLVYDAETALPPDLPVEVVTVRPGDPEMSERYEVQTPKTSDLGCILMTSGTTGASKACQLPWGLLHAQSSCDPFDDDPATHTFYVPYAPFHLSGRSALYRGAITRGHTVVRESFSTSAFWVDVREHGCTWTLLYAAPTRFLAGAPRRSDDHDNPLRRALMCPLVPEVDELKERFGFDAYSVWGMTETGSPLVLPPELADSAHAGSCGFPVDGVQARLVDGEDYPVPPGTPGELVLRSDLPWRFLTGYQGAPEATAAAYRNGWFHTGDVMAEQPEGTYRYVDRSKDMIRRRGENVSSVELEAAVLAFAGVAAAAAVGVPSPFGDEDILVAVVADPGHTLEPAELYEHLRAVVPRFALPGFIRVLAELPRTQATQRVQKHELRAAGTAPGTWTPPAR